MYSLFPRRTVRTVFSLLLVSLFTFALAQSQNTYTWTGASTNNWSDANSWSPARTGAATNDIIVFNSSANVTLDVSPAQTIGELQVTGNAFAQFTAGASDSLYIVNSGTSIQIDAGSTFFPNTTIISGSGTLNASGTLYVTGASLTAQYPGFSYTFNSGSTAYYAGNSAQVVSGALYDGLTVNTSSGVSCSGTVVVSGTLDDIFTPFLISSGTLTIKNPVTGNTTYISGGSTSTLIVAGTASGITIPSNISELGTLEIENTSSVGLAAGLSIDANVIVFDGQFLTNGYTLYLNPGSTLSEIGRGAIVVGNVQSTRTVSSNTTESFGGIGLSMTASGPTYPGSTTITRVTGTALSGNGNSGIKRYYNINAATNTGLNANLVFKYDSSVAELNSLDDSKMNLFLSRTSQSAPWYNEGYSSRSPLVHTVTLNGVTDLSGTGGTSTWTLSDSLHPLAPPASTTSDVIGVGSSESATVSSISNASSPLAANGGVQVWQVTVRDGGASSPDADSYPTIMTGITFTQGSGNQIANWSNAILAADLFNGNTHVASGTISATSIAFTGLNESIADNGSNTYSLRISLQNPLGSGAADHRHFDFAVTNANVTAASSSISSQFGSFSTATSNSSQNAIAVVATKMLFTQSPVSAVSSTNFPAAAAGADANGNLDSDFTGSVTLSAIVGGGTLSAVSGLTKNAVIGTASWADLQYSQSYFSLTIKAHSGSLTDGYANFPVTDLIDSLSDIADSGGEASTISSLQNLAGPLQFYNQGTPVWTFTIRDGGASENDADQQSTIVTGITITQGAGNSVPNWGNAILAADLFYGTYSHLGSGVISNNSITFSGIFADCGDNLGLNLTLHISLKNPLGAGVTDGQHFDFAITSANVTTEPSTYESSQMNPVFPTALSDSTKNQINVAASQLVFTNSFSPVPVNVNFGASVLAKDANGNTALNFTGKDTIAIASGPAALLSGNTMPTSVSGTATTSNLSLDSAGVYTFSATSGSMHTTSAPDTILPPTATNNIVVKKVADNDGSIATKGDETPVQWGLSIYKDSIGGTLIASGDSANGVLTSGVQPNGTYILVEADSSAEGWLALGKIHLGVTIATVSRYDTVTVSGNANDTVVFINSKSVSVTALKFRNTTGHANNTGNPMNWQLSIYKDSTLPGHLIATKDTSVLTATGLIAGTYILTEADSGASWTRLKRTALSDTVTVTAGTALVDSFINFQPNSITVDNKEDVDGNFTTTGDRVERRWSFEVHKNSPSGPFVGGDDTDLAVTLANLGNGTYSIIEADSTGWIRLGYVVNSAATADTAGSYSVTLNHGANDTIVFVQAPPVYGQMFRTFAANTFALSKFGSKTGIEVKKKNDEYQFVATLVAPAITLSDPTLTGFHIEFSAPVDTSFAFILQGAPSGPPDSKLEKWDFTFASPINAGQVSFDLPGRSMKKQKVSKYWFTHNGVQQGPTTKSGIPITNAPLLPMPNAINAIDAAFAEGRFPNGLLVGENHTLDGLKKKYAWVLAKKYTDVMGSLYAKGLTQTGLGASPFSTGTNGKALAGAYKSLPPTKFQSRLLADLLALKVNLAASAAGITPQGLGQLTYSDTVANPFNGLTLDSIATQGDSIMAGYYVGTTHTFRGGDTIAVFDSVVAYVNSAFDGPIDTLSFSDSLKYTGVATLSSAKLLHSTGANAAKIKALALQSMRKPLAYKLYQNYPNPFNPTTTIQFDLPEKSTVTLKVYNILGQEVTTLFDHASLNAGSQVARFNASNYASGVYFYRIDASPASSAVSVGKGYTKVEKMLLIK